LSANFLYWHNNTCNFPQYKIYFHLGFDVNTSSSGTKCCSSLTKYTHLGENDERREEWWAGKPWEEVAVGGKKDCTSGGVDLKEVQNFTLPAMLIHVHTFFLA
jgi:hypothetical protein